MRWLVLGFAALAYANTETVSFRLPLTQFDSLGPVRLSTERGTSLEPHRLVLGNLGVTRTALHAIDPASTPVSWVRRRVQDLERQFGLEQQMVVLSWSAAVRSISSMNQYADATPQEAYDLELELLQSKTSHDLFVVVTALSSSSVLQSSKATPSYTLLLAPVHLVPSTTLPLILAILATLLVLSLTRLPTHLHFFLESIATPSLQSSVKKD